MFWFSLLFFLIAACGLAGLFLAEDRFGPALTLGIAGVLGVAFLLASMISMVDTRHVGIVKAYGKPTGRVTGAGLQWTKPWEGIDDSWDATRQSYNHLSDKCENPGDGSLWVQIAGQRNMCVRVQVNWQIAPVGTPDQQQHAADLWATYRERDGLNRFESFAASQVTPGINSAVLATFRTFDPLSLVDAKTGEAQAPDLAGTYTKDLTDNINRILGADIEVKGVAWGLLGFDAPTTALISQRGQKVLESRNLEIDKANAAARKSLARDTGIPAETQACLDAIKALGKGEPGLCVDNSRAVTAVPVG